MQTMADASTKYVQQQGDMLAPGGGQLDGLDAKTLDKGSKMLFPVGLNLLEKGTQDLITKLTDERTKRFMSSPRRKGHQKGQACHGNWKGNTGSKHAKNP